MNDDEAARLLRSTGSRPGVPPERAARVHSAVRLEWMATLRRRRRMRRAAGLAAAALVALFLHEWPARRPAVAIPPAPVAVVERADESSRPAAGAHLSAGAHIATPAGARMTLSLPGIASVRVDESTRLQIVSSTIIELSFGAVYIETAAKATGLEVKTPLGRARDIGTRFEVRVGGQGVVVRVRSGTVELRHPGGAAMASEGTQLALADGRVSQTVIPIDGPQWSWITRAAALAMEGRTLAAFLDRAAAAEGWTVRYADAALEARAQAIILHGSAEGLSPADAIGVAVATSGLAHRVENGAVVVFRP